MRDTASGVAATFPVLTTVALAAVLVAATAVAAVPRCRCCTALALATTITVNLATAVAAISRCRRLLEAFETRKSFSQFLFREEEVSSRS
jgi:hypothetical protein